ncbi:MAG: hypothetical protein A2W29_04095 [Gemmatimonadetes bacterium RBG_16_66_8]|nr:MAG: hypothetical protein A2W29_04095 [Gemmatimonadetes bacterium RBG_16_66_8]
MTGLSALWLPILVSAVFVFIVSSVIHMALPWHKDEYPKVPDEDKLRNALKPLNVPPGDYMVPRAATTDEMKSPEFAEKLTQGPVLILTVLPNGPWQMGRNLSLWFIYSVIVSVFAAYVAGRALGPGSEYLAVFRFTGATAFVGYALALWQMWVWYHRSLKTTVKATVDGLVYALVTAGAFGWLWP